MTKAQIESAVTNNKSNDHSSFIILEGRVHGNYSYPDLEVSMYRLGINDSLYTAAHDLKINLEHIGNIDWNTALSLNQKLGNFTLNARQFFDFRELLKAGIDGNRKVFDGTGKLILQSKLTAVYNDIFEVRTPVRAEWIDASFIDKNGILHMNYNHHLINRVLQPTKSEPLEFYLINDGWIDLKSINRQGLPTKKLVIENVYYEHPRNGSVAGFHADSGGAVLYCNGYPSFMGASLGVRAAREFSGSKR